jgi:hypothetical protein
MTRLDGRINSTIYSNLKNFLISINYFECNRFFLEVIIFGSVRFLLKKNNQTNFFLKKTKTGSNQPVLVFLYIYIYIYI